MAEEFTWAEARVNLQVRKVERNCKGRPSQPQLEEPSSVMCTQSNMRCRHQGSAVSVRLEKGDG